MLPEISILTFSLEGLATAAVSTLTAINEEIMCSLGYSNQFSGLVSSLVIIGGVMGAIFYGPLVHYFNDQSIYIVKASLIIISAVLAGLMFVMNQPGQGLLWAFGYFVTGFITIGYDLSLYLSF